jgi:hypothetical protein
LKPFFIQPSIPSEVFWQKTGYYSASSKEGAVKLAYLINSDIGG